ncbi:MAG: cupin domain-containing protein [Candidatus Nitrosocosmicus sp.]|nr:cupin domain-containing protein [Candidatus Nitrosocosmicus sp.]MDN5867682.1 cupin domain-containing protein [Candidatus Nitrosocosmicus sp.]
MDKIFELDSILLTLDKKDNSTYFLDFLHNNSFEVVVLRLNPGKKDTQSAHSEDELYFVMEGKGYINMLEKNHELRKGSCIFVPSKKALFPWKQGTTGSFVCI